ncbi:MAG: hypothetical protein ACOYIF_03015 [Acetivibrionales bacterium]|jgi:hypothetical protein
MNNWIKKYISILMCFFVLFSFVGCGEESDDKEERRSSREKSSKTEKKSKSDWDYDRIVICGIELYDDEYYIKRKSGTDYLMIERSKFKSCFKIPYLPNSYPDFQYPDDGLFSIIWEDGDKIFLRADLAEGSTKVVINGKEYDMGMAPEYRNDKLFIPSNFFIALLEMEDTYDRKFDILFIDRKEDFPKDILVGMWSNIDTNLFVGYKDITSGIVDYPSFAQGYAFNKDGTYRVIMISTGGFENTFLYLEGKYVIHGNTIACYDILETLHKGDSIQLVHRNKRLDYPHFYYIYDYDPDPNEERIQLTFWLKRNK